MVGTERRTRLGLMFGQVGCDLDQAVRFAPTEDVSIATCFDSEY